MNARESAGSSEESAGRRAMTAACGGLVARAVGNNEWKVEEIGCMSMGEPQCTYRVSKR
jgi:predicted hydrocarbon binding protein